MLNSLPKICESDTYITRFIYANCWFQRHITRTLQAAEMQRRSRAEVTLNVMESRMERARIQLSRAASRDMLRSIRNELAAIIKTLAKVKHKVSFIISRKTQLEVSCDEMQQILFSKEDGLPVSSEPVDFDSCEFRLFLYSVLPTNMKASASL